MTDRWGRGVGSILIEVGDRLTAIIPGLLAMIILLILGLLLAWLIRVLVTRVARAVGVDGHTERWGLGASMRRAGIHRTPAETLGILCSWAIFVLFASLGIDALASPDASAGATAFLIGFVPPLFAAVLIVVVGWIIANFVGQGILIAAVNAGLPEARLLARAAHWAVLLFAIATALTHLGIGKEMVLVAFGITFGGLVLAVALAFGLGGRTIAAELLSRRLRREGPPDRERLTHL
jgi:mechanosensitive ion channel-like protein